MVATIKFVDFSTLAANFMQAKKPYPRKAAPTQNQGFTSAKLIADQVTITTTATSPRTSANQVVFDRQAADRHERDLLASEIQSQQKRLSDAKESVRISLEKGEIWVYNANYVDEKNPENKAYRLQNQPADFEGYIARVQYTINGLPSVIKHLQETHDQYGKPSPEPVQETSVNLVT